MGASIIGQAEEAGELMRCQWCGKVIASSLAKVWQVEGPSGARYLACKTCRDEIVEDTLDYPPALAGGEGGEEWRTTR